MPVLKQTYNKYDDMKPYSPVPNLNFVSKLIEEVIPNRIRSQLEKKLWYIVE